uniref:Uncharacterized protein n=2 Tax=Meloidogyne TaxID=189290 RepID=A0A6V7VQ90_MELEN|nr:unnamed protein product [Meloidogyne enterolobii]
MFRTPAVNLIVLLFDAFLLRRSTVHPLLPLLYRSSLKQNKTLVTISLKKGIKKSSHVVVFDCNIAGVRIQLLEVTISKVEVLLVGNYGFAGERHCVVGLRVLAESDFFAADLSENCKYGDGEQQQQRAQR